MDLVSIIMIYVLGVVLGGMFSAMFMDLCLNRLPTPFSNYSSWQSARKSRVEADSDNFARYKALCEREKSYARDALFSIGWVLAAFFWPITIPLLIVSLFIFLLLKFSRLLRSLGSLFESAKGV